jgi:hypothetical protein
MRSHPALSIAGLVLISTVGIAGFRVPISSPAIAAENDGADLTRRDLRNARTALEAGRWQESVSVYERALDSPLAADPEIRAESLYVTALVMLQFLDDTADIGTANERLAALASMPNHPHRLEVSSIQALVDQILEGRKSLEQLIAEQAATRQAHEDDLALAAEDLAASNQQIYRLQKRNRALRQKMKGQSDKLRAMSLQLESRELELSQSQADVDFLTGQLAGTHQDQAQMLEAVMGKNDELRKQERELSSLRRALQQQKRELATQAEELNIKEEEVKRREEAIREVTERILQKDPPDS